MTWKPVVNYESLYEVSNFGAVRSVKRAGSKGSILKAWNHNAGYYSVCLSKQNEKKTFLIHRLVADAFLQKIEGKNYINHKDGDKRNNTPDNLEWVSIAENNLHAVVNGLRKECITVLAENKKNGFVKDFYSFSECSRAFGLGLTTIRRWATGDRKQKRFTTWCFSEV